MKNLTQEEIQEKLAGYDTAIVNIQSWKPAKEPSDPKEVEKMDKWRAKKAAELQKAKAVFSAKVMLLAAGVDPESVMIPTSKAPKKEAKADKSAAAAVAARPAKDAAKHEKVKAAPKVIPTKTLTCVLKMDLTALSGKDLNVATEFKSGAKVSVSFLNISTNGLHLRIKTKEHSGTITLTSGTVVQALESALQPATDYYSIASLLPKEIYTHLGDRKIVVIDRTPEEESWISGLRLVGIKVA